MTLKPGADISKLHPTLTKVIPILDLLWQANFPEDTDGMTITSGNEGDPSDGIHAKTSHHYPQNDGLGQGHAIDIRLKDVSQRKIATFCGVVVLSLYNVYGDIFTVFPEKILTESSHLHVELKS